MRLLFVTLIASLLPFAAQAYVGPGAGLGMIGSLVAVVGALLLALLGVVMLPLRMVARKRRRQAQLRHKAAPTID